MDQRDNKERLKPLEQKTSASERRVEFKKEAPPAPEKKRVSYEKAVSEELKREIEMMQADEKTKLAAEKSAQKIQFLGQEEKIEHLLKIADEKGVVFAVKVAKSMNDPYLLDIFHDVLAREGLYKNFIK